MSNGTKRTLLLALVLVLSSVACFGFMAYQVSVQGQVLKEQIVTLEAQRSQDASFHRLLRLADETAIDREQLQTYYLEREGDSIDFLSRVESTAPKAGVHLETNELSLVEEKGQEGAWVSASFTFSGDKQAVQRFVQILETLPYVQRLVNVTMKAQSPALWEAGVTMQVRILSYDK